MKTLIQQATLIFPGHAKNGKEISVLTDGKRILSLSPKVSSAQKVIKAKGMYMVPGLVDVQSQSGEPGYEDREDFASLTAAARAGGFTDLMILPSTDPVIDSKSAVNFVQKSSGLNGVELYAYGALSKGLAGSELSEMFDMHRAGAVAFTDGKRPIHDVNMMTRALHYAKNFGGIVVSFPNDQRLSPGGMVNESPSTASLGLKVSPSLAEELMLNRDLYLLEYSDSALHVATISTKSSVSLLARAKKSGLNVTAGVALANLLYTEESLQSFDTNFKTNPPLRTPKDRKALIKAVNDGTIDCIVADHCPETIEAKDIEFDHASYGMITLETALAAYYSHLKDEISFERFIEAVSIAPRNRFGLSMPSLKDGEAFSFTLFDPTATWTRKKTERRSKSENDPLFGKELTGKVIQL